MEIGTVTGTLMDFPTKDPWGVCHQFDRIAHWDMTSPPAGENLHRENFAMRRLGRGNCQKGYCVITQQNRGVTRQLSAQFRAL
jgi:hypothetical protein